MKAKKGISLIVLVITIIVIIILAGAVILSLANNNPVNSANKATFLAERSDAQSSALMAYSALIAERNGGVVTSSDVQTRIQDTLTRLQTKYTNSTWAVGDNNEVTVTFSTLPAWLTETDRTNYLWLY